MTFRIRVFISVSVSVICDDWSDWSFGLRSWLVLTLSDRTLQPVGKCHPGGLGRAWEECGRGCNAAGQSALCTLLNMQVNMGGLSFLCRTVKASLASLCFLLVSFSFSFFKKFVSLKKLLSFYILLKFLNLKLCCVYFLHLWLNILKRKVWKLGENTAVKY